MLSEPFHAIRCGGVWYVVYVLTVAGLGIAGALGAIAYVDYWLDMVGQEHGENSAVMLWGPIIVEFVVWLLAAPFFLTAASLPARSLHMFQRFELKRTLRATVKSLENCGATILMTLHSSLQYFIPAIAVVAGWLYWARTATYESISQIYLIGASAVFLVCLFRLAPILLCPMLCTCGQYSARYTMSLKTEMLRHCRGWEPILFCLWLCLTLALHSAVSNALSASGLIVAGEIVVQLAMGWYLLTLTALVVLDRLTAFEADQAQAGYNEQLRRYQDVMDSVNHIVRSNLAAQQHLREEIPLIVENLQVRSEE